MKQEQAKTVKERIVEARRKAEEKAEFAKKFTDKPKRRSSK